MLPVDDDAPTPVIGPAPALLPGSGELLPAGTSGAAGWFRTSELPPAFDASVGLDAPANVAEAFAAAVGIGGGGETPDVAAFSHGDERAVLVLTDTRGADDSTPGTQHALVLDRRGDGWRLGQVYLRQLCRRGATAEICAP